MAIGEQIGQTMDGSNKKYGSDIEKFLESQVKVLGTRVAFLLCFIGDNVSQNAKEVCHTSHCHAPPTAWTPGRADSKPPCLT